MLTSFKKLLGFIMKCMGIHCIPFNISNNASLERVEKHRVAKGTHQHIGGQGGKALDPAWVSGVVQFSEGFGGGSWTEGFL